MNDNGENRRIGKSVSPFQYSDKYLRQFVDSISPEEIDKQNEKLTKQTIEDYNRFHDLYKKGICNICKGQLSSIDRSIPCSHWLLRPSGFKKEDFKSIYQNFGYFRVDSFLRWVANIEGPLFRNINDLEEEKSPSKILEHTIVFKNIEWSFSCTKSDFEGHINSIFGKKPHYHFQMRINGRPFINYNDYHPEFSDNDLWKLTMMQKFPDKFVLKPMHGAGLQYAISEIDEDVILNKTESTTDPQNETYILETLIQAKPGEKISGETILKLYERSKAEKRSMAGLAKELDADVQTFISLSNNTPSIAARKPSKKGNKKKNIENNSQNKNETPLPKKEYL
jgi:hypothetical protein